VLVLTGRGSVCEQQLSRTTTAHVLTVWYTSNEIYQKRLLIESHVVSACCVECSKYMNIMPVIIVGSVDLSRCSAPATGSDCSTEAILPFRVLASSPYDILSNTCCSNHIDGSDGILGSFTCTARISDRLLTEAP
jgi:hypothetical protein